MQLFFNEIVFSSLQTVMIKVYYIILYFYTFRNIIFTTADNTMGLFYLWMLVSLCGKHTFYTESIINVAFKM